MLSTVGVEVTNSINPDLNWKTVTKGRRSRKPVARNVNGFAKPGAGSPKRVGDFSVSDTDKLDELAAGRQGPDQVEQIPIKKRRHLLQSPSPPPISAPVNNEQFLSSQPQTPSPHADNWRSDSTKEQLKGFGGCAAVKARYSTDGDNIYEKMEGKLYNPDDFSGIELLAAAACIDDIDLETPNVKKNLDMQELSVLEKAQASTSPNDVRSVSCDKSDNYVQKDVIKEECTKYASAGNSDTTHEDDKETMRSPVACKVDRLHWDLNTVMDAWEQPFDEPVEGASSVGVTDHEVKEEMLEREGCEKSWNPGIHQSDVENHTSLGHTNRNRSELIRDPGRTCTEIGMLCLNEDPAKSMNDPSADAENFNQQVADKVSCNLHSLLPESHHVSSTSVDEDVLPTTSGSISVKQESAKKFGEVMSGNIGLSRISSSSSQESPKDSRVAEVSVKTKLPDYSGINSCEADDSHSSLKCEDLFVSGAPIHFACSPKGQCDQVVTDDAIITAPLDRVAPREPVYNHDSHSASMEVENICSHLDESSRKDDGTQSDDPNRCSARISSSFEDGHNSDVSQDDRSNMIDSKNMIELQAGYDSPYEDGELRVPIAFPWEEVEIEDGETECVDYDSDDRGVDSYGADCPASEVVEAGSEGSPGIEKRSLGVKGSVSDFNMSRSLKSSSRTNDLQEDIEKFETSGDKSNCGFGPTSKHFEHSEDSLRRRRAFHMDGFETKDFSRTNGTNSRTTRGKLQSHIEGPPPLDVARRKETGFLEQGRSHVYSRPVRESDSDKFAGRQRPTYVCEENRGNEQWGYWDSRNRFASSYRGSDGHGYARPRSIIDDSGGKFGGLNSQDHRQALSYSSKGPHRALGRRSPYERDDYYSFQRRQPAARETSINKSRGSSGSYSQGVGRVFREEYHEPLAENRTLPASRMPRYLSRRERSFSPLSVRVPQNSLPRRRSRSRSRSRSPNAWNSQRERNPGLRRHSRSPNFRYDTRLERVRVPFQKPNFPANNYSGRFVSPPRGRFSPQRNGRWVDENERNSRWVNEHDRNDRWVDDHDYVDNYPRNRRSSPMRIFRRGPRFDSLGSSGRLKSDEQFRPAIRPAGRFPPFAGAGRGYKFDDNCDDGRRDDRTEIIHRTRPSDTAAGAAATAGRFRHDTEDNFEANNSHKEDTAQSTDQRNVPRSSPEDKRSFKV